MGEARLNVTDEPAVLSDDDSALTGLLNIAVRPATVVSLALAGLRKSLRKEVIQPQVLLRLPCYDFVPVTDLAVGITEA